MAKVSLGQAARIAGMSKSTLQRMLASGRVSGHQREDSVWEIDMSEVQRLMDSRDKPQRGRKAKASAPVEDVRPEAIEIAELRANLEGARQRLDDMIARAEAAEAREAAERERVDRLTRLIEDQRPRGLWSRLTGR
jgi:septal ring factor EnvC (AmiA/AmiB activator)